MLKLHRSIIATARHEQPVMVSIRFRRFLPAAHRASA